MESGTAMYRIRIFVLSVLLVPIVAFAGETPQKTEDPYAVVASENLFAMGAVGVAAKQTDAAICLREIVKRKDGLDLCRRLVEEKNPVAQLYGLVGLKYLDSKGFAEAYPKFEKSRVKVQTASGCELSEKPVWQIAREIRDSRR